MANGAAGGGVTSLKKFELNLTNKHWMGIPQGTTTGITCVFQNNWHMLFLWCCAWKLCYS